MYLSKENDTIAAMATPPGPGGIGIIRISGSHSLSILKRIFKPANPKCNFESHVLYYGFITDPESGEEIDETLCVYMKAPKTYTREDVVEIQCHSGVAVMNKILDLCLKMGARLAMPGEFTKRAFLNGRIDLTQAEAINELVTAQASGHRRMSMKGLKGDLAQRLEAIREGLLFCLSALEVAIDYPEEDSEIVEETDIRGRLQKEVLIPVTELLNAYEVGAIHRFGAKVLLVGRPNAGKSSLLNVLACQERAIVTEIPGTTRDIVEQCVEIGGVAVTLMDTAGIRQSPDPIEAMGIDKIGKEAAGADLFLWLLDPMQGIGPEEQEVASLIASYAHKGLILVINKIDKLESDKKKYIESQVLHSLKPILEAHGLDSSIPVCSISAKTGEGLSNLTEQITAILFKGNRLGEVDVAPNMRQKQVLQQIKECVERAFGALEMGLSPDVVAIDMRQALDLLGEITGETVTEDILDQIFSSFCLGK